MEVCTSRCDACPVMKYLQLRCGMCRHPKEQRRGIARQTTQVLGQQKMNNIGSGTGLKASNQDRLRQHILMWHQSTENSNSAVLHLDSRS